ncbi:MAG: hypothetical protein QGG64_03235, partial [Candidatus Latescibacteria bacterium]|nr:hypothetical protein [Candidatus Latescibacterota bacterium]
WTGRLACSIKYTDSHLTHHSSARWSTEKRFADIERLLFEGGPEARSQSVAEKKEAERLASNSLRELEKAKALFSGERYLEITGYFEESQQQARINQVWVDAYYALRYIRNYPANIQAKKGAEATRQACHAFLKSQPATPKTLYEKSLSESEWNRFRFANLPQFVKEMETALKAL